MLCFTIIFRVSQQNRNLVHTLLILLRDISHSRENESNYFQPKGNVEKRETRNILDFSLSARKIFKDECDAAVNGITGYYSELYIYS